MIKVNKLNNILYKDYGIILNESEISYLNYLNSISNKNAIGILKEFFTKCTTRHLCVENNKQDLNRIRKKLLSEEISNRDVETTSIAGKDNGNANTVKYLNNKGVVEIEEETNTLNGNNGLNIKKGNKSINKEFETKEEADRYRQEIANNALVNDGQLSHIKRFGGTYWLYLIRVNIVKLIYTNLT